MNTRRRYRSIDRRFRRGLSLPIGCAAGSGCPMEGSVALRYTERGQVSARMRYQWHFSSSNGMTLSIMSIGTHANESCKSSRSYRICSFNSSLSTRLAESNGSDSTLSGNLPAGDSSERWNGTGSLLPRESGLG